MVSVCDKFRPSLYAHHCTVLVLKLCVSLLQASKCLPLIRQIIRFGTKSVIYSVFLTLCLPYPCSGRSVSLSLSLSHLNHSADRGRRLFLTNPSIDFY